MPFDGCILNGIGVLAAVVETRSFARASKALGDTRVVTCASRGYLEEHGRPRHPRDLASHDAIQFRDPATGRPFEWTFVRGGRVLTVTPRARMIANDVTAALAEGSPGGPEPLEGADAGHDR
jgi:DNA-binding transcriptional LysR family regulator